MSHAKIASLVDGIRNEFSAAHPSLPDKGWLHTEATKLLALVEALPDAPVAPATAQAANTAQTPAATNQESMFEKVVHGVEHALHLGAPEGGFFAVGEGSVAALQALEVAHGAGQSVPAAVLDEKTGEPTAPVPAA